MSLRRLALAATLAVLPALAPAAAAAQQTVKFNASQPLAFNNGRYLVGPFAGTVTPAVGQATGITMFCVDVLNTVSHGQTWSVNVRSLADGVDLAATRHPAQVADYRKAAFLADRFASLPTTEWTGVQYAMWQLLNPGTPNGGAAETKYVSLANAAAAANFQSFTHNSVSYGAFEYWKWEVLTDVRSAGVVDDAFRQEFITKGLTPVPEPATVALMATGLLLTGAIVRRRARA